MPPSVNALPAIAFSKNKIKLQIHSDDFQAAAPAFAVNKLTLFSAIAVDTEIAFSWAKASVTLKFKAVPDLSGLQVPSGAGDNAHATAMLPYLEKNYFIQRYFTLSINTAGAHPYILFTAYAKGPDYTFAPYDAPGVNFSVTVATAGVTDQPVTNFYHFVNVIVQNAAGTAYLQACPDTNVPLDDNVTGNTTMDIGLNVLDSFLSLDIPDLSQYWQACTKSIRKYLVKYAQFYGDPGYVRAVYKTSLQTVVYGGYSNLALSKITNPDTRLQTYLLPDPSLYNFQRWFEAWPIDKFTVKTNQPQFLYFINNRSMAETLSLKIDLVFSDASLQTIYIAGGALQSMAKICVGCGYRQLGLQAYTTTLKYVSSYTVTMVLASDHTARSLPKQFTVNRDHEEYTRYFLYSDSAGNFKTLRTYGKSSLSADISADQVSLQVDPGQVPVTGNYQNSNILSVHNDSVNTGYISARNDYDALMEVHLAKQVYRVFGNTLIPIVITSKNFNYSADGVLLNADLLEYRLAYDEQLYTGDSYAQAVPQLNQSQQAINDL